MRSPRSSTVIVRIEEHRSTRVAMPRIAAGELARAAGHRLQITPSVEPDTYEIRATQHVGSVSAGGVTVHVRPKVAIDNVLLLLGAAPDEIRWGRERFGYAPDEDLVPAFVAFFARVVERTLHRGLLRSYRPERARLRAVRGRIDFAEQLRTPGVAVPMACAFDEFTADIALNRYLKAAVRRGLLTPGIARSVRRALMAVLVKFDEVVDEAVRVDGLDGHVFTRLDRSYEPAVRLARLLLAGEALTDRSGSLSAQAFMIDMNRLFEAFVEERLRQALRDVFDLRSQHRTHLDVERRVPVRPDLVLLDGARPVYVADVKYKLSDSGIARHADYYQALAYATALSLPEALLVYCHDDGDAPPTEITVRGSGVRLVTYRLDLSGGADDLARRTEALAAMIRDRARCQMDECGGENLSSSCGDQAGRTICPHGPIVNTLRPS